MQTCTKCNQPSPDPAEVCSQCGADLSIHSTIAQALGKMKSNPRVSEIRLIVADDACPACRKNEGTYAKDALPELPDVGCSHRLGCRCFYEPVLNIIFP